MAPIKTNNPYASYFDFFSRSGTDAATPAPPTGPGLTATGGLINLYESGGNKYRAHVFYSSGTFTVTELGTLPASVEYLVVGGGGGGGTSLFTPGSSGGGGGAGGGTSTGGTGTGGSGVVILRLPTADYSGTTTGSPTVTTDGLDTILTYTGSGTYVHS